MVPTLTLKIYQEEEQNDREEQIVHLTIHVLTSGKQSGHPGNTPRGIFIWPGHTFHAGDLWHSARPLVKSTYKLPDKLFWAM